MQKERIYRINDAGFCGGNVIYWMSRDQRAKDNWALIHALEQAKEQGSQLAAAFCLQDEFLGAMDEQFSFMLAGLQETRENLRNLNIPLVILHGKPNEELPKLCRKLKAGLLVCDFDPLKIKRQWKRDSAKEISIAFHEVDAHNIVPCRFASDKQEFAARTIRPKVNKKLDDFLVPFPEMKKYSGNSEDFIKKCSDLSSGFLDDKFKAHEKYDFTPGEKNAVKILKNFISDKIDEYDGKRNDPNEDALSNLSPYLHFGQVSAQRAALEVDKNVPDGPAKEAFLEELIIRRELSDNFCFYNDNYDNFDGFADWAKKTLNEHRDDKRDYIYSAEQFEAADTHEGLWNAAQLQMMKTGKMHGYMRMYWGKKILEWTPNPEEAMAIAIYLNDKYELDGRDPNGYTGIAWSIGGVHDRAWPERDVFGKVRYMNYNGAKRKFDVKKYIEKWTK